MKKTAILCLVLFLFSFGFSFDITERIAEWKKALVWCNYQGFSRTSGFFLSKDGILVTPQHLVGDEIEFVNGFKIFVKTYDGEVHEAKILRNIKSADLLFLKINYKPEFWFSEFEDPEEGQRCILLGFPKRWRVGLEGKIIIHMVHEIVGIDRIVMEGASGSAIISEEGKVLGMIRAGLGYGVFTPSVLIKINLGVVQEKSLPDRNKSGE